MDSWTAELSCSTALYGGGGWGLCGFGIGLSLLVPLTGLYLFGRDSCAGVETTGLGTRKLEPAVE